MPSPVRFSEFRELLQGAGYELVRISGSHHIFAKEGCDPVSVPVHKSLVKYGYVRRIKKIIEAEGGDSEKHEDQAGGETGGV